MKTDYRNAEAKARDAYLEGDGKACTEAQTLGKCNPNHYLRNRIERAFLAGVEAGKKIEREKQSKAPITVIWRS